MGQVYAVRGSSRETGVGGGGWDCEDPAMMDSGCDNSGNEGVGVGVWDAGLSRFARLMLPILDDDPARGAVMDADPSSKEFVSTELMGIVCEDMEEEEETSSKKRKERAEKRKEMQRAARRAHESSHKAA